MSFFVFVFFAKPIRTYATCGFNRFSYFVQVISGFQFPLPPCHDDKTGRLWDGFRKFRRDKLLASKAAWVQLLRARSLPVMGVARVAPVRRWHRSEASRENLQCAEMSPEVSLLNFPTHTDHRHSKQQSPHFFFFFSFSFFFRILFEFFGIICRWCCSATRSFICRYLICVVPCLPPVPLCSPLPCAIRPLLGICRTYDSCSTSSAPRRQQQQQ